MLRTFVLRSDQHAQALWAFLRSNWKSVADSEPLQVVVSKYRARRSGDQNRRYWAILNQIAAEAWIDGKQFSADAWHEWYKRQYIGFEELPSGAMMGISTTKLTISEFADYMTKVEMHATTELGLEILI